MRIDDATAMTAIANILDQTEDWSADTLDDITMVVLATGRDVAGQEGEPA